MTKPASYTPGKWKLGEGFLGGFGIVTESGGLVCDIARIEDAKLIAASPDLLEALQDLVGNIMSPEPRNLDVADALAAIAKATGE